MGWAGLRFGVGRVTQCTARAVEPPRRHWRRSPRRKMVPQGRVSWGQGARGGGGAAMGHGAVTWIRDWHGSVVENTEGGGTRRIPRIPIPS